MVVQLPVVVGLRPVVVVPLVVVPLVVQRPVVVVLHRAVAVAVALRLLAGLVAVAAAHQDQAVEAAGGVVDAVGRRCSRPQPTGWPAPQRRRP